jgi:hypothetical protein
MGRVRLRNTVCLVLILLFSASILTVEYHQDNKGNLRSRCPTCIEGSTELAVSLYVSALRFYLASAPFTLFCKTVDRDALIIFSNICRGPPPSILL